VKFWSLHLHTGELTLKPKLKTRGQQSLHSRGRKKLCKVYMVGRTNFPPTIPLPLLLWCC